MKLASRTNDINDRKRLPCDGKSSPLFFAVARQCFRATRNLSRYCNWCSLDCVHEIDLPDFTVAYSPRNHSSWHREMFWFVSWNSAKSRRGLTGLSLNPKPYFQVVMSLSFSTQEPICCSIELFWIQHRFHLGATQKYSLLTSSRCHVTRNLILCWQTTKHEFNFMLT